MKRAQLIFMRSVHVSRIKTTTDTCMLYGEAGSTHYVLQFLKILENTDSKMCIVALKYELPLLYQDLTENDGTWAAKMKILLYHA